MYELSIGGKRSDSAAIVYDELTDLNISENPTSVGTWDASIPYTKGLDEELMTPIYVYYEGDVIFKGILESVESSFDSSSTKLSGRGILVELEYQADTAPYSNTTVFDALRDYWENYTSFDASVLPPNRDLFDAEDGSNADLKRRFSFDGGADDPVTHSHYNITNSQVYTEPVNFTEDVSTSASTIATDGSDTSDSAYSKETAVRFDGSGGTYLDYDMDTNARYHNDNYAWNVRLQSSSVSDATLDFYIEGTHVRTWSISSTSLSHQWVDILNDTRLSTVNSAPSQLDEASVVRIEVSGLGSGEWIDIDAETITDETYGTYTLPGSTNVDGVYTGPEWYPDDVRVDGEQDSGTDIVPSSATDRFGAVITTEEKLPEFTVELKNKDTGEVVSQTHTHVGVSNEHYFDFQFSDGTGQDFSIRLIFDGEYPDTQTQSGETIGHHVSVVEIFAPDESKFSTIDDAEFNGTKFDILKSIHERGTYRFALTDYENDVVESFPQNTIEEEPFWRIKQEQRKLDYSEYANKVTVQGKTKSDGTYNEATVSDQDEIDVLDRTVHKYEKNPEIVTQSEVDSRADVLLQEKINEKDESGSMDVVPKQIDVGYTYPVSTWSDAFRYGGRIGTNALNFRGSDGAPDYVEVNAESPGVEVADRFTFEVLIYPRNLDEMGANDYVSIISSEDDSSNAGDNDFILLYGDGSVDVGFGTPDASDPYRARSKPEVVDNEETQRLSVIFGETGEIDVFIDGQLKDEMNPDGFTSVDLEADVDRYNIGVDSDKANPFDGGIDDVRFFYTERTPAQIDQYAYEDLATSTTADLSNLPYYLRFDDRSDTTSAIVDSGTQYTVDSAPITGATYEASYGRLEEIQYSLGTNGNLSLNFDISGRVDTELVKTRNDVKSNRRNL